MARIRAVCAGPSRHCGDIRPRLDQARLAFGRRGRLGTRHRVIAAYKHARNDGDPDEIAALFSGDAVLVDSAGRLHSGGQQIARFLQRSKNADWSVSVLESETRGEYILWTERVGVHGTARSVRVEALVRNGSIKALAYGHAGLPPAVTSNSDARPLLPASIGVAVVALTAAFGMGSLATSGGKRNVLPDRGELHAALAQWNAGRTRGPA